MALVVTSPAFTLEDLPVEYTGNGSDVSPPLEWTAGPPGTRSYALVMDDPDGPRGAWIQWIIWNIRGTRLDRDVPRQAHVNAGEGQMRQGRNSYNRLGYAGPCPPGGTHRYFFKVYALDTELDLGPDTTRRELLAAMEGHILDYGEMMASHSQARAREAQGPPADRAEDRPARASHP
jgi:Raf kinase inhibitor-like YbhB/YbcL family protein